MASAVQDISMHESARNENIIAFFIFLNIKVWTKAWLLGSFPKVEYSNAVRKSEVLLSTFLGSAVCRNRSSDYTSRIT
jgi:hypothetical protein